jgi:hypothetical protein
VGFFINFQNTTKSKPSPKEFCLVHFLGKEMDSKTVTIAAPVNSLEVFLIRVLAG